MAGETMKIKTTVFEGGAVIDNSVQTYRRTEADLINKIARLAGTQHYDAVAKVRRGKYD